MSFKNMFDNKSTGSESAEAQLNANVRGTVQGVGFRWWTKGEAQPLGLVGYAKNMDDGSVEIVAQGTRENCQKLLDTLNSGNTAGHVEHVDANIAEPTGSYKDFGTY
ncbi:MAG: acylphosphatase [Rothia sp. (in: high G+C Gram-positive bacteria)]|nr:acylphosphatase [Rothia sp. (in: high G+C Gram-positive bacteria)]